MAKTSRTTQDEKTLPRLEFISLSGVGAVCCFAISFVFVIGMLGLGKKAVPSAFLADGRPVYASDGVLDVLVACSMPGFFLTQLCGWMSAWAARGTRLGRMARWF